jgi:hypothetical protein
MLSKKLLPLALALATAGCAAPGTPTPLTDTSVLQAFKPLPNSAQAPCPVQQGVAEHNSVFDTLRTGKPVVYKAPCDLPKQIASVNPRKGVVP